MNETTELQDLQQQITAQRAIIEAYRALIAAFTGRQIDATAARHHRAPNAIITLDLPDYEARRLELLALLLHMDWFAPGDIGATSQDTRTRDDLQALVKQGLVDRRLRTTETRRPYPYHDYRISQAGIEKLQRELGLPAENATAIHWSPK